MQRFKKKGQRPTSSKVASAAIASVESMESRVLMSTTLADWTFETSQPATAGPFLAEAGTYAGSSNASGSHAGAATYSTPSGNGSAHSYSSNTWATGDYYQFATSTSAFQGISLTWDQTSSNTGPGNFQLQYSTDGSTFTPFGSQYTVLANGTPNPSWNPTTGNAAYTSTVDLSSVTALNNAPTVYFRLVDNTTTSANGGTVASAGTDRVDNVLINASGSVATAAPTITSVTPVFGNPSGGNTVTINGTNFTNTSTVSFGGTAGTSTTFISPTQITSVAPAHANGTVDVSVTNAIGTSAPSAADKYTFVAGAPSVTSVADSAGIVASLSPAVAYDGGGTKISITGSNFSGATAVSVGGVAATNVTVVSDTQITAVVAATTPDGSDSVAVTGPAGTNSGGTVQVGDTIAALQSLTGSPALPTSVTLQSSDHAYVAYVASKGTDPNTGTVNNVNGQNYTSWGILVTDATGSMELFGALPKVGGGPYYVPHAGDNNISVTGKWAPFNEIPEIGTMTALSSSGTISVPAVPASTVSALNVDPVTNANAAHLVSLSSATITGEGSTFGISNSPTSPNARISDASSPGGMVFFYWPSSFSQCNSYFNGTNVPTTPVNITGIVSGFGGNAEFVPMYYTGVSQEKFTITSLVDTTTSSALASDGLADAFSQVPRGDSITVTVHRSETDVNGNPIATPSDVGHISFAGLDDSAINGHDYSLTSGTLNFPASVSDQTFTITTSVSSTGNKIFQISLANASSSSSGFLAYAPAPQSVVISDPNSTSVEAHNSYPVYSTGTTVGGPTSIATVQAKPVVNGVPGPNGVSSTLTTFTIESNSVTGAPTQNGTFDSFGVLDYNNANNDPSNVFNITNPIGTVTGVEIETVAIPASFEVSGALNVYLVSDTASSINKAVAGSTPASSLFFDKADDVTEGLYGQLGSHYLLGQINYSATQQPGAYTAYNLTNLDATGVSLLQASLNSNGTTPFRIVVTPADRTVAAEWVGSNATVGLQSPIIRVNYHAAPAVVPPWLAAGSAATWAGGTLTVTGNATIIADPAAYGDHPNIVGTVGAAQLYIQPAATGFVNVGNITLSGGAGIDVVSVGRGRTHFNHNTLVVDSISGSVPTVSIDSSSKLNLEDNDLIVQNGGDADYNGTGGNLGIYALAYEGRGGAAAAGAGNGTWTGNGITSSAAAADDANQGFEHTQLVVAVNGEIANGSYATWQAGTSILNLGANDIIVKYTYTGDNTLDGAVDGNSAGIFQLFFGNSGDPSLMTEGDLGYEGSVSGNDAGIFQLVFGNGTVNGDGNTLNGKGLGGAAANAQL